MSKKEITIISTHTWDKDTLFDGIEPEVKGTGNIYEEYIKEQNWTSLFNDEELANFYEVIKDKLLCTIRDLLNDPEAREDAIRDSDIKEKLINIISEKCANDPQTNDKVKESICAIDKIEIFKVGDADVYGIKALRDSKPAKEWIPFLLSFARTLVKEDDTLSVNLFLHDKDVKESSYYHDFIKEPNLKNLLPEKESLENYNIEDCTVIFYKHTHNPIINFISRKPDGDLSNSIKKIKEAANNLQAMVDDYKKINPESGRQRKPDGDLSNSIKEIKKAVDDLQAVIDGYKKINPESGRQGTGEVKVSPNYQ